MKRSPSKWTKANVLEESKKYSSRTEFCKKSKRAYETASKNGWLDEMPWLKLLHKKLWTKDDVLLEAKKYDTLKDFIKYSVGAYNAALRNNWLDDIDWLSYGSHSWSDESVINESRKYHSRTEFARKCVGAYMYAKKHGLLDMMDWLPLKVHPTWTKEECIEESKKYTTRKDFSRKSSGAYTAAITNKWLDDMPWLALLTRPEWTKEECIEEGKKYKSRSEYQKGSSGAYQAARAKGWLDDMPWLTTPVYGDLKQIPHHCVYVYTDDENKACYIGRTNRLKKRDREHRHPYKNQKPDSLKRYFDSLGIEIPFPIILKKNLLPEESQYWEDFYLKEYKQKGYKIINRGKTGINIGSLGGGFLKWNKKRTLEESKQYRTFGEFGQGSPSAYQSALKNDWLKEMKWLTYDQMPNGYWTKERVIEESKKYKYRHEMEQGSPAAYSAALKNGWSQDLPLKYRRVGKDYYTKEKIFELSQECTSRSELKNKYSRAYVIARKSGWLDEMTWLVAKRKQRRIIIEPLPLFKPEDFD